MKSLIIITFITFSFSANGIYNSFHNTDAKETSASIKEQAFQVLQGKCNVCHEKKNKRRVFTLENMDRFSNKINRQVFKWKRMPKGNDIKLSSEEQQQLRTWILSLKK